MTKLVGKEFSPLIIRRYSLPVLMFIGMIADDGLDNLDDVVEGFLSNRNDMPASIQGLRNLAGELSAKLSKEYSDAEGIAVIIQADKMVISSLSGDFMNHGQCRLELFSLLNFMTQV